MLKLTHRAWAAAFWLGGTLAVDAAAAAVHHPAPVHPVAVAAGTLIAPAFSAGRYLSPDMDHRWWPGPPRRGYPWRGHRGVTHRPWLATALTVAFGVVPFLLAVWAGASGPLAAVVFAPVDGWWSHLTGDMIYGRLPVWVPTLVTEFDPDRFRRRVVVRWRRRIVGLGWTTGGVAERGGRYWRNPGAGVCSALSLALIGAHLAVAVRVA